MNEKFDRDAYHNTIVNPILDTIDRANRIVRICSNAYGNPFREEPNDNGWWYLALEAYIKRLEDAQKAAEDFIEFSDRAGLYNGEDAEDS